MKGFETIRKAVIKVGLIMAKVDTKTSCPWINYQPSEPDALVRLRKQNEQKQSISKS